MENNELKEFIIFVLFFMTLLVAWYFFWVKPHNEFLYQVMDCMKEMGATDEATFNICAERIKG